MTSHGITQADKVIIVMGPTGAGKSTFIDYAMGGSGQGIGHNMKSCTQDIVVRRTSMGASSQFFAFVDTPGLDDTHKQDYDILEDIAKFLIKAHKDGLQLDKVLYLHRISDNRLTVPPEKSLEVFASLCDNVEIPPVTIVTTMWSLVPTEIGQLRSTELRETLQSKTKGGGWQIVKFDGTTESARAIAQAQRESPNAASCTKEHADNGETPSVTEANTVFSKQPELSPKKKEAKFKLFPLQGNPAAKRPPSSDTAKYGIARDDKIIIIMGPTGVGKSTFIDYATGRNGQGIGHTLKSSTQGIVVRKTVIGGQSIAFVDTPGFDDTVRSDYEILGVIAEFFINVHKDGLQMEKIFYLHRISDNRVSGTPLRNLELFASMCGNIAMPTVTIVTTMWSLVRGNTGQQRMASLCATFWKRMADGGCDIVQFEDSVDSAHEIALRPKPDPKKTLLTQELIDKGKRLNATEAGIMLSRQLERLITEEKEASLRLEQLSRQQMNPAAKRALEYELNVMKESIEEKASELGKLNRSLLDIVLGLFSKSKAPVVRGPDGVIA